MSSKSIRVLHVDDEPDFAELAATYLEREDERFDVETATSAEESLDRLADDTFDCVVSDYDMPRTNGIEFLERVREAYPELPFILFTGKGSEEVASDAISAGVTDYLQKGRDTSQYELLANRITNAVDQFRAEQRARLQERQYRELFENAPVMYVLTRDEDGQPVIEDCNDRFVETLDYDRTAVIGRPTTDFYTEESTAKAYEEGGHERTLRGEFGLEERTLVTGDGERIDTLLCASPRLDERGDAIGGQTLYLDITDRKERERDLEWYETIIEASGDAIYTLDADGRLTFVNDAFCELVGYAEDELLEENVSLVMEETDIKWCEAVIRDLLRIDETHETLEMDLIRADGERVTCETHIALLPFDNGEFRGTTGIHRDITERKRREEALDALHDATRTFIEAPDKQTIAERAVDTARTVLDLPLNGLWLHDADADVLRPVAATEEGKALIDDPPTYTEGESLSWDAFEDGGLRIYNNLQDEPKRLNPETPIRSEIIVPLGEHGVMNVGATEPAEFDDIDISLAQILGNTVEAALSRAEREEQLRAQRRELERQNERLDEFASVISHDLRNPLNVAEGRLELAREECDSEPLDAVARALARMDALIDDLLTLARDGESVEDVETVDLTDIVDACWKNVETADATLVVDTELTIHADRSRLAQLLENLIRNAVEHGGTDVTITVGDLDDGTGFYVADDGPGIPADERDDVFEYGYSTSEEGTGFGLVIVKEISQAHGWEVTLTDSDDGGARFEITGVDSAA